LRIFFIDRLHRLTHALAHRLDMHDRRSDAAYRGHDLRWRETCVSCGREQWLEPSSDR
jgi:hypothetical protein